MNIFLTIIFTALCLVSLYCFHMRRQNEKQALRKKSKKAHTAAPAEPEGAWAVLLRYEKFILPAIFLMGILVRVSFFWDVPNGLNQDEASIAYDTYADLTYGMDRNGFHNPVYSVAWGSGHSSLYITLSKPFIALFGLNLVTARIVNVLFGCFALFAFYGILKHMNGRRFALLGLFLFAITPWHIMFSRWGLECNLFPNVFLIATYFLVRGFDKQAFYPLSTAIYGLSLYAYGTSYMVVPVFLVLMAIYLLVYKKMSVKMLLLSIGSFIVVAVPIGIFMIINSFGLPSLDLGWISFPKLVNGRYNSTVTVLQGNVLQNIWTNLKQAWHLLVYQDDGLIWNAIPGFGTYYLFSVPFMLLGLLRLILRMVRGKGFRPEAVIAASVLCALVLSSMSTLNINRANFLLIPVVYCVISGIMFVIDNMKYSAVTLVAVYLGAFLAFSGYYFTAYQKQIGPAFFEGAGEAILYAGDQTDGTVYLSGDINAPYIIAMFYEKTDPQEFLDTVDYLNPDSECRFVSSFGRYVTGIPKRPVSNSAAYVASESEISRFSDEHFDKTKFGYYYAVVPK